MRIIKSFSLERNSNVQGKKNVENYHWNTTMDAKLVGENFKRDSMVVKSQNTSQNSS